MAKQDSVLRDKTGLSNFTFEEVLVMRNNAYTGPGPRPAAALLIVGVSILILIPKERLVQGTSGQNHATTVEKVSGIRQEIGTERKPPQSFHITSVAGFSNSLVLASPASGPDINGDDIVDFRDYAELAKVWRRNIRDIGSAACDLDGNRWVNLGDLRILSNKWLVHSNYVTIHVDDTVRYQEMDGFGASLTESSAWLICNCLTPQQRGALMEDCLIPMPVLA